MNGPTVRRAGKHEQESGPNLFWKAAAGARWTQRLAQRAGRGFLWHRHSFSLLTITMVEHVPELQDARIGEIPWGVNAAHRDT